MPGAAHRRAALPPGGSSSKVEGRQLARQVDAVKALLRDEYPDADGQSISAGEALG